VTTRAEQKLKTRRALLDAALQLSYERGFASLSLREVAREAGISPAAFYRHFADMDALALVLVDEVGLSLRKLMRQSRQRAGKGRSVFRVSIDTFMEFLRDSPNLFRLLLGERLGSSPAFRKAFHAEIERFVGELTEDLERGGRLFAPRLAAEAMVAVVFTVGAEALDLPPSERAELSQRLSKEIIIIYRGSLKPSLRRKPV
jgi:TetR/AcrR family transcriptional regulator, fatty acid biosynthesis regulator